ncbi:MAG TPA: fumarylacetoacetate hydrolase family protein [Crenalkalicoccus sp.]|jgi:2-keto-4-pentenoate hydratase|nr:fumarylacetoacetate hydrolase family protein [Crenalkalicoccus sp.]
MDAAGAILEARRVRRLLNPLGALAPVNEAAGYAVQRDLAERLGALPPAGFKIGATTQRMQEYLGLSGPAAGFVAAAGLHRDGAVLRHADFLAPGVECEIAVRLGGDLPPGPCTQAEAEAAVAELFPAIEVVERRYADLPALGAPTLIADQVFHAAGVPGTPVQGWRQLDLDAVRGVLRVDGAERGVGFGRDLLGHPLAALAWLAGSGAALAFGGLRAGQVVFLGSVTLPVWLDGPAAVEVEFEGLGRVGLRFA